MLSHFRKADIEKIFQFDFSEDALVMNYEKFQPEYMGLGKMTDFLADQKIDSFREIINITALWRPHCKEIIERIELYKKAQTTPFSYGFLSEDLEQMLKPNFGTVLYHEDILKIISKYTGWELARSNSLRRDCMKNECLDTPDWTEFNKIAPKQVVDLVTEESKWTFCMPHAISFAKFTKQTAVLKSLHKKAYYSEIEIFEKQFGFKWDDIGIRINGVSLHQG